MSVNETTGRAAIERVLEGIVGTQEVAGVLPGGSDARQWAEEVAIQQIKIHEEREARQGIDDLVGLGEPDPVDANSAARLDRGEVPDDAVVINKAIDESPTPQALQHMGMAPVPLEDQLALARLKMLTRLDPITREPVKLEWFNRVEKAKVDGDFKVTNSGSDIDRSYTRRRYEAIVDETLKVLELSIPIFGDWRQPKQNGTTKLMYINGELFEFDVVTELEAVIL